MYSDHKNLTRGTLFALASYTLWGVLPVFWKLFGTLEPGIILAHRIVWALVFTTLVLVIRKNAGALVVLMKDFRQIFPLFGTAALVSVNWYLYIWAVSNNHIVESALGYYINPLVSVVLGIVFLKEKLAGLQIAAFVLACAAVLILGIGTGTIPFISLGLALSFGFYGLLKKKIAVDTLVGLQAETLFAVPLALFFLLPAWTGGQGPWGSSQVDLKLALLLLAAGPVTALPLWLFATGAKLIPLTRVGFLQYLNPTLSLLTGILIFKESFDGPKVLAFLCIWAALIVYSLHGWMHRRRPHEAPGSP